MERYADVLGFPKQISTPKSHKKHDKVEIPSPGTLKPSDFCNVGIHFKRENF